MKRRKERSAVGAKPGTYKEGISKQRGGSDWLVTGQNNEASGRSTVESGVTRA